MASTLVRGALLIAGTAMIGGAAVAWFSLRSPHTPPAPILSEMLVDGGATTAASTMLIVPDATATTAADASGNLDDRIASFKNRLGDRVSIHRGGPGWAVLKTDSLLVLAGRSKWIGWCRAEKRGMTVDAPPQPEVDGGVPSYRNPKDLSHFELDDARLLTITEKGACPHDRHEYLSLDDGCSSPACEPLKELRAKTLPPKSIVLRGARCTSRTPASPDGAASGAGRDYFVCDRVSLVYDLIDDDWVPVANPPERPDPLKGLDIDGHPVFAHSLVYATGVDLGDLEATWSSNPLIIDAYGFESWDGARWSMTAPALKRVYEKAYARFERRTEHLKDITLKGGALPCDPGDMEAVAKATVARYAVADHSLDRSPFGFIYDISDIVQLASISCFDSPDEATNRVLQDYRSERIFDVLATMPMPSSFTSDASD